MAHADRYAHLIHLTSKEKADADYTAACYILSATIETTFPVSYTHLDVYKRQRK